MANRRGFGKRLTTYKRKCFVCGKFHLKENIKGNTCNPCREKRFKQYNNPD